MVGVTTPPASSLRPGSSSSCDRSKCFKSSICNEATDYYNSENLCRDMAAHTKLKTRTIGQSAPEEVEARDLKTELREREEKHYKKLNEDKARKGLLPDKMQLRKFPLYFFNSHNSSYKILHFATFKIYFYSYRHSGCE